MLGNDVRVVSPDTRQYRPGQSGLFTAGRVVDGIAIIFRAIWCFLTWRPHCLYITVSQTPVGYLRDAVILLLASLLGIPRIVHIHGGYFGEMYRGANRLLQFVIRHSLGTADAVLVLSPSLRGMLTGIVPEDRIFVVPNGVDVDVFAPRKSSQVESVVSGRPFRMLFLSNLIRSKGYEDVIRAAALLHEKGFSVEAVFAGAFPDKSEEEMALGIVEKLNVRELVTFLGVVTGQKKVELLQDSDVFVLPTYYPYEGLPISVIEAMSVGLPVIVTRYRGLVDLVEDGVNGFFVPPRDSKALADRLETLIRNDSLRHAMREANVRRVRAGYTLKDMVSRVASIIHAVASNEKLGSGEANAGGGDRNETSNPRLPPRQALR